MKKKLALWLGCICLVVGIIAFYISTINNKQVHSAITPTDIPLKTRLKSLIDEGADMCLEPEGFYLTDDAIRVIELPETGESLTVLDESEFICPTMASVYCGSGGCSVHFLLEKESISLQLQGWEYKDGQLLFGAHGTACGNENGSNTCFMTVTVKEGHFNIE